MVDKKQTRKGRSVNPNQIYFSMAEVAGFLDWKTSRTRLWLDNQVKLKKVGSRYYVTKAMLAEIPGVFDRLLERRG